MTSATRRLFGFGLEPEDCDWLDSLSDSAYMQVDEICGLPTAKGTELGGLWSDHLEGPVWELPIKLREVYRTGPIEAFLSETGRTPVPHRHRPIHTHSDHL